MPRREIAPGRSCLECRRRKIKCDRSHPCSYCVKVRINCKYPASRRAGEDDNALSRVASLESKIVALEKRLAEVEEPSRPGSAPGSKLSAQYGGSNRSKDPVYSEVRVPRVQGEGAMLNPLSSPPAATAGTRSSMLLQPQAPVDLHLFRPTPSAIAALWQRYLEIVDPVLKIFHTPTVQMLVFQAIQGRDKLDLASECLLFAIYYAIVAAMTPSNYKSPLLITGRNDPHGPDVYALVGLAIGMALKMGLNQDGEAQGYPPFEVEIRRRVWWQLFTLDIRVAEDRGSEPCILESSFNTRLPSNVADTTLHPAMSRPPHGQGRTEMLFSLVRFEGSYFARQMVFSERFRAENSYARLSSNERRHAIDLFQERIEKQYLGYCDERIPLDRVTVQSIRLILAKLRLVVAAGAEDEEDTVSKGRASTRSTRSWARILHDAEALRGYKEGKQWLWLFQTYIEWDGIAHLLQRLRADPPRDEDEQWGLVSRVYSYWKEKQSFQRDGRWKGVQDLWSQVLDRRSGVYTT
ncbi:hypothetical protein BDW67DRAFT_193073 [Aspergillus spinulosporus]